MSDKENPAGGAVAIGYMDPAADFLLPKPDGCVLSAHVDLLLVRDSRSPFTQPVYTTPPATVPLDAVLALVAKWRAESAAADQLSNDSLDIAASNWHGAKGQYMEACADELEALTREAPPK